MYPNNIETNKQVINISPTIKLYPFWWTAVAVVRNSPNDHMWNIDFKINQRLNYFCILLGICASAKYLIWYVSRQRIRFCDNVLYIKYLYRIGNGSMPPLPLLIPVTILGEKRENDYLATHKMASPTIPLSGTKSKDIDQNHFFTGFSNVALAYIIWVGFFSVCMSVNIPIFTPLSLRSLINRQPIAVRQ